MSGKTNPVTGPDEAAAHYVATLDPNGNRVRLVNTFIKGDKELIGVFGVTPSELSLTHWMCAAISASLLPIDQQIAFLSAVEDGVQALRSDLLQDQPAAGRA